MKHSGKTGSGTDRRSGQRADLHSRPLPSSFRYRYAVTSAWIPAGMAAVAFCASARSSLAQDAIAPGPTSAALSDAVAGSTKLSTTGSAAIQTAQIGNFGAVPPNAGQPEASPGNSVAPLGNTSNPNQNTTGNSSNEFGGPPTPISNVPRVGLFPALGASLLDDGLDLHGLAFDRTQTNTSAGVKTHQFNNLVAVAPTLDADLGKLAGITGGNLHVSLTFNMLRANEPNFVTTVGSELVGNLQGTPALSGHWFYLSELTYEQRLLHQKLSIEFGQTSVFRYFFLPNSLDPITYYSTSETVDGDFPTTPFPTWGSRATYRISPRWYAQVGAFDDNYLNSTTYPLAFGGRNAAGAQILGEAGYRTEFTTARYPANLEMGVEYDTRHGYFNSKGSPAPDSKLLSAANYPGGGIFYAQGLQTGGGGAPRRGAPPPNISLYGSIDVAYDKPQPIDMDALLGFNFTGLVPGRKSDAIGAQVRYQRLSAIEAAFETRAHDRFVGPGPSQKQDALAFELIYSFQVLPSVAIRPLAEYFINPDNIGNPTLGRSKSGAEFGLFTIVSLGRLFGTSTKPF